MKLMQKKNKKGFTLVELIIVVAVMAILVAVAVPTVVSVVGRAEVAAYNTNAVTIESTIKAAIAENDGKTLTNNEIDAALEAANLGLNQEAFIYSKSTGKVLTYDQVQVSKIKDAAGNTTDVEISLAKQGATLNAGDLIIKFVRTAQSGTGALASGYVLITVAQGA